MNCCSHSTWLFLFCGILLLAVTYHHHFLPILSKNKKIIIFHYNETSPVNLHTFWEFNVMSDFVVLTCLQMFNRVRHRHKEAPGKVRNE